MSLLSPLDAKDRRLLLVCAGIGLTLAILAGILMPNPNNDNPMPSSYLAGRYGARAAYETLLQSGYQIERWERPLSELAATAGPTTVVIFAEPFTRERSDIQAVRTILERGGRVLSTGFWGGAILPGGNSEAPRTFDFSACKLEADGFGALAGSGEVWMRPEATWKVGNPTQRVDYTCAGEPAVVEYKWDKGQVVWWASSTPLENASLARAQDLDLLLNSLGPREGHRFYWDESLHGEIRSEWSYAKGAPVTMLEFGLPMLGVLVVLSFSRRSGPVRELPAPARATPVEFLEALGSLYGKAGAASTAVAIAWERFRRHSLQVAGIEGERGSRMGAAELAATIRRRFGQADRSLEADLADCEEAAWSENVEPREALRLVQRLREHEERLKAAIRRGGMGSDVEPLRSPDSREHERAS